MMIVIQVNAFVSLALNGAVALVSVNNHFNHVIVLIHVVSGKKDRISFVLVMRKVLNVIPSFVGVRIAKTKIAHKERKLN